MRTSRVGWPRRPWALDWRHVVVTCVTRDDLPDGGAEHFVRTIAEIRRASGATIEVLPSDFAGNVSAVDRLLAAGPEVYNHNSETVPRLYGAVRGVRADYRWTLAMFRRIARHAPAIQLKTGLMLGLGETTEELLETLADLRAAGCRMLTLGQYLQPSPAQMPVVRYLRPEEFERLGEAARRLGFSQVASGPLVRSSYHAREMAGGMRDWGLGIGDWGWGHACGFATRKNFHAGIRANLHGRRKRQDDGGAGVGVAGGGRGLERLHGPVRQGHPHQRTDRGRATAGRPHDDPPVRPAATGFAASRPSEDLALARRGLDEAREAVASGKYSLVILDEANVAVALHLLSVDDLLALIDAKMPEVELVLTGRGADARLIERADLVTEMRLVKHYFQQGVVARRGIEK